jgi:polysaccharide transporter, PST family
MTALRRLFTNAAVMYANEGLLLLGTLLVSLRIIDYLGPERFGLYSTVLAFLTLFKLFTESSGVDDLLISDLAVSPPTPGRLSAYASTGILLRIALGATAYALALTVAWFLYGRTEVFGLVALLGAGMLFSFNRRKSPLILHEILTGKRLAPELATFAVSAAVLGGKLALIAARAPLALFVLADLLLILGLSAAFLALAAGRKRILLSLRAFDPALAREIFIRSLPVSLSGAFVLIFMRIDQIMLSKMRGMEEVGYYGVSVLLVEGWSFVPMVAAALFLPLFARHRGSPRMALLLRLCFRATAWGALAVIAATTLFGGDLLRLLWGERYLASGPSLQVLVWCLLFMWTGGLHGPIIISHGLQRYIPPIVIAQAAVNVVLNLVLIPSHGAAGASLATCVSFAFGFALAFAIPATRFIAAATWKETLPPLLLGLLLFPSWPGLPRLVDPRFGLPAVVVVMAVLGGWSLRQARRGFPGLGGAPA